MSRNRTITYMVDPEQGMVYSRVGDEVAIPVLDWEGMKEEDGFKTRYFLEKFRALDVCGSISHVIHTRKIPLAVKNGHRRFWGMRPLAA